MEGQIQLLIPLGRFDIQAEIIAFGHNQDRDILRDEKGLCICHKNQGLYNQV